MTQQRSPGPERRRSACIAASRPDVVLSDLRMPGLDGLELLRLLHERVPGVDVILMTAFDDLPLVATAMRGLAEITSSH